MSLVLSAHNCEHIVVAWDGPSRYRDPQTGQLITPPAEFDKVMAINGSLALMITGTYASTKLPILQQLAAQMSQVANIEEAFDGLYGVADMMRLTFGEGFRIGLAGYHGEQPTYRFVQRDHTDPHLGYIRDYPIPYYVSGTREPVEYAEGAVRDWSNPLAMPTADIHQRLGAILTDCIERFPALMAPVRQLTLDPPP